MLGKKLSLVAASVCALAFGAVLVSPALARRSPQSAAPVARELARLRAVSSVRSRAAHQQLDAPHPARAGSRPRIVGGYGAVQSDWPFMAFIVYFDAAGNPLFYCTGTVVSPNVVLTAAHCAVDEVTAAPLDPSGFAVVTGSVDWTNQAQRQLSPVSRVIVNPSYVPLPEDTFDAALLVLSKPTTARPIPLATSSDESLDLGGTGAAIAGWGATYYGDPLIPALLEWAPTVVQNPSYCAQFDPYFDASSELCAVNPPDFLTGTCNGDSGGPLAAFDASGQLVEIGITTNGRADCSTTTADNFANAIPLSSWVSSWIQAVAAPPPSPPPPPPWVGPPPTPAPPPSTSTSSTAPPTSPPPLPTMTLGQAKRDVRQTVVGALGKLAKPADGYVAKCARKSSTRFTCAVAFSHGPNDYYGSVTVHLLWGANGLLEWTDNYALHWVNDQCYFHSGHPQRCAIQGHHGTW